MTTLPPEFWLQMLVFIVVAGAGGVGTLLFFVLRSIRDNQVRIWDWAMGEVKSLHSEVRETYDRHAKEGIDTRRWIRHELRSMYGEIIELAKIIDTKDSENVVNSINDRLREGDL